MNDENLKKFCEHYEVKILNDSNRVARYHAPSFFNDMKDADVINRDFAEVVTERLYTLQMPESRLKTLVEMERMFFRARDNGVKDMFDLLMEKEREERNFRNQSEAIKTAYEQYSTLLYLAGYQRKI